MKEKYIFFTLLMIALLMLAGKILGQKETMEFSDRELILEKQLQEAAQRRLIMPKRVDIAGVQDLVPFSRYDLLARRNPFVRVHLQAIQPSAEGKGPASMAARVLVPVAEETPLFKYKGKITLGDREVVIIEQTRMKETFMVSKGEKINGYKVLDISDTEVILSKKGEENIVLPTIEKPEKKGNEE